MLVQLSGCCGHCDKSPNPWCAAGLEQCGHVARVAIGLGRGFPRILPVPGSGQGSPFPLAALTDPKVPLAACLSLHPAVPLIGPLIPAHPAWHTLLYTFLQLALCPLTSSFSLHTCCARAPADSAPPLLAASPSLILLEPVHALFKFNLPLTQPSCAPRAGPTPQTPISPSTALPWE